MKSNFETKLKNQKGINLITLSITVVIILVLTNIVIYNVKDNLGIQKLKNMQTDIDNLRDKIASYYANYGKIPANTQIEYTNIEKIKNAGVISDAVDTGKFYIIDLAAMENVTLTYGQDYEKIKSGEVSTQENINQLEDLYIINEASHNIFYVKGVEVDKEIYYTDYTKENIDTVAVNLRYVDGVKIPDGFYYSEGRKDTGIVISDIQGDDLNNSKQGNQFVWIPVERESEYIVNSSENTEHLPNGINSEKQAVINAGGFYISRFEAGKEGTDTLVSKKNAEAWSDLNQTQANEKAKTFINNEGVKSALCTETQLDVAKRFINSKTEEINIEIETTPTSFYFVLYVMTDTVEKPVLKSGMNAVYWDESGNEITDTMEEFNKDNWYNYENQKWANAKTSDGSYWVWIPRYEYKVTSASNTTPSDTNAGTVEVNFLKKENTTASNGFILHPAFTSDVDKGGWNEELAGIWVAKYEMSMEENGTAKVPDSIVTGNIAISDTIKMVSKPGVSSWRYINIANSYTNSYNYDRNKDSHLIKNSEWGAVALLTHSKYGRNGTEVAINENSSFYTGGSQGATATTNASQSTTGNATGIYDMNGGSLERVAAFNKAYSGEYFTDGEYLDANGKHFASTNGTSTKYLTAYSNSTGSNSENFTVGDVSYIGDAIHEVHLSGDRGWFNDYSYFVDSSNPFFTRGGYYGNGPSAGVFYSGYTNGSANGSDASFRVVLPGV